MGTKPTLETRVLQRAAELLGSERALARRLHVPQASLAAWLGGAEQPPRVLFLEAVDVLIEAGDLMTLKGKKEVPARDREPRRG